MSASVALWAPAASPHAVPCRDLPASWNRLVPPPPKQAGVVVSIPAFSFGCRYFEGGVSSVYLWDLDHGFAGVILIKKAGDGSKKIKGCWDSIHVVEVQVEPGLSLLLSAPSSSPSPSLPLSLGWGKRQTIPVQSRKREANLVKFQAEPQATGAQPNHGILW